MADGVSSWQRYGVNPALFAWELMVRCEEAAIKHAGKLEVGGMLENMENMENRPGNFSLFGDSIFLGLSGASKMGLLDIVVGMFQRSRCLPKVRNLDGMSEHCKPESLSTFRSIVVQKYLDGKDGFLN